MVRHVGSGKRRPRGKALSRLKPDECAGVLRALLDRHPKLAAEAEEIARAEVTDVDAGEVAEEVAQAVLCPDIDDLNSRAGSSRWGYVEPTEAAWEILEEATDPFLEDMKRNIELGFRAAAVAVCGGIVLGLYRCRGDTEDKVLNWAPDFPLETACHAVSTLAEESMKKHRRAWTLPDSLLDQVPEWTEALIRCSKPRARRR